MLIEILIDIAAETAKEILRDKDIYAMKKIEIFYPPLPHLFLEIKK